MVYIFTYAVSALKDMNALMVLSLKVCLKVGRLLMTPRSWQGPRESIKLITTRFLALILGDPGTRFT